MGLLGIRLVLPIHRPTLAIQGRTGYIVWRQHDRKMGFMDSVGVTFVTLFLSLTTGLQPVEVTVNGPVAVVEIRIDGETVGEMRRPPWGMRCDFGSLRPIVLEAVAFDTEGIERARARQVVNLPRAPVETAIALERGEDGQPHAARLISDSGQGLERISFHVTLDGETLEVTDPDHFNLPPSDVEELHFLSARVDYTQGVVSHAEVSFGGPWAGETSTELTAVPLLRSKKGKRLNVGALEGCVLVGGREATVMAVEGAPAILVIVVDRTAEETLRSIYDRRLAVGTYADAPSRLSPEGKIKDTLIEMRDLRPSSPKLRLISTIPQSTGSRRGMLDLFPMSPPALLSRDAVMWLLANPGVMPKNSGPQQVADAVAVAGLAAAGSASPRAVLLVLGSDPDRDSRDAPENVRGYLESVNVPLFVWQTSAGDRFKEWGECTEVTTAGAANGALRRLIKHLDRQTIVWLDGAHLPNQIELKPGVEGLEIAR